MKHLLLILAMFVGLAASSQTSIGGKVDGSYFLPDDQYGYFWGTTADTVETDDTVSLTLRVKGETTRDLAFGITQTDSVTVNYIFSYSMDGITFTDLDTIAYSDVMTTQTLNLDDFVYPYLRIYAIFGGTDDSSVHKLFYISRKE